MASRSNWEIGEIFGFLYLIGLIVFVVWVILSPASSPTTDSTPTSRTGSSTVQPANVGNNSFETDTETTSRTVTPVSKGTCIDVTSYDNNWNNDMKCTRPDGTVFYTDYAGAREYEN